MLADHGLRPTSAVAEVDAFIHIGRHLQSKGLPVPTIHFADAFAGLVFLEDLGDTRLQSAVLAEPDRQKTMTVYRKVVDSADRPVRRTAPRALTRPGRTKAAPTTGEVILERECRYFCDAFLRGYVGLDVGFDDFADEFDRIADHALADGLEGFMHRDMQSRNIMLKERSLLFHRFPGRQARPGSVRPGLPADRPVRRARRRKNRSTCSTTPLERMAGARPLDAGAISVEDSPHCALCRNLQVLGAFGFLTAVKGKTQFTRYIPAALRGLASRLAESGQAFSEIAGRGSRRAKTGLR